MLLSLFIVVCMAFLARLAGGGYLHLPGLLGRFPEALFAVPFGLVLYLGTGVPLFGVLGWLWSYVWMETGHGTAFHMGRWRVGVEPGREQFLSPIVDAVALNILGLQKYGRSYCWLFMGLKGWLIGLPVWPYGVFLGVLWPLAYEIGFQLRERTGYRWVEPTVVGECLSGAFAGAVIGHYLHFS